MLAFPNGGVDDNARASGGGLLDEAWIVALRMQLESIGDELGRLRGGLGEQARYSPAEVLEQLACSVCETHTPSEQCCVICLVDFALGDAIAEIPACHHVFHQHCLSQWLEHRQACPMCRFDLLSLLPTCSDASGNPQLLEFQAHLGQIEGRMQDLQGRIQTLGAVTEVRTTVRAALHRGPPSGLDVARSAGSERLPRTPRAGATASQAELLEARGDAWTPRAELLASARSREGEHARPGLPGLVARTRALVAAERLGHTPWAPRSARAGPTRRRPSGPTDGAVPAFPAPREAPPGRPRWQLERPPRTA